MNRQVSIENYRDIVLQDRIRQALMRIMRDRRISEYGISRETGVNRATMAKFIKELGPIGFKPLCAIEDWIIEHTVEE